MSERERSYHADIYLPCWFNPSMRGTYTPYYSQHARDAAWDDRYGPLQLPGRIDLGKFDIVELRAVGKVKTALVIRGPSTTPGLDICLVIRFGRNGPTVATVWGNLSSDAHRTLDRSRYEPAPF